MQLKRRSSLAVLAAAAGLTVGAAQAQSPVTPYGQVDAWAGATRNLGQDRAWGVNSGGMSTSYWGLKGSEDPGNGLKAIFTLEAFFRPDTGRPGRFDGDHFFARNSFIGLQLNTWGSIKPGCNTPLHFVSMTLFNPFIDSYTFSSTVFRTYLGNDGSSAAGISGLVGDLGWDNSVMYSTPDMGGPTGALIYGTDEQAGHNGQNKWGGSLPYLRGNFAAMAALQQVRYGSTPGDLSSLVADSSRQTVGQLDVTYDFGVVRLHGQYQYIKNAISTGDARSNGGQFGVSIPVGPGSILASHAYTKTSGVAGAKRNTQVAGHDYLLLKHTDVYAAYFRDKVSDLSTADTLGVGICVKS